MRELDTIGDFTDYLSRKEVFFRSGKMPVVEGEQNLLANYAVHVNQEGEHDFVLGRGAGAQISSAEYKKWINNPQYLAKKDADRISYVWDDLIETFTSHMLDGTSIVLEGHEYDLRRNELAVRHMALARRFARRSHGEAFLGALKKGMESDSFSRMILAGSKTSGHETAFFIMTLKYLPFMDANGGYEKYRQLRILRAELYAKGLLIKHPHLKRVVGISREPPMQGAGISEDIVYAEQFDWTEDDRKAIRDDCEQHGILQDDLIGRKWSGQEYPEVENVVFEVAPSQPLMNRQERRAQAAMEKRESKIRKKKG